MTSNIRITIVIILVLLITFSVLILEEYAAGHYIDNIRDEMWNITEKNDFYGNKFTLNNTIFLLGSSHVDILMLTK
jgi:hypothetical protein